jgi:hypothetical protein
MSRSLSFVQRTALGSPLRWQATLPIGNRDEYLQDMGGGAKIIRMAAAKIKLR